jgi:hypothetical protein
MLDAWQHHVPVYDNDDNQAEFALISASVDPVDVADAKSASLQLRCQEAHGHCPTFNGVGPRPRALEIL